MTEKEKNLRVFQGREVPGIFFQPRIEPWFHLLESKGTLPEELQGMDVFQAYQHLGLSMRYLHYGTGMPGPITIEHDTEVPVRQEPVADGFIQVIETPHGELETHYGETSDAGHRIRRFPVQNRDDLKKLEWLFRHTRHGFSRENFEAGAKRMGALGEPQFFVPRSPYQALSLDQMKYEDFVIALMQAPEDFDPVFEAIDESYAPIFQDIIDSGVVNIVNFGENVDARLLSPQFFETYHIPFYEKFAKPLRDAGIYTHVHFDGDLRPILPYFKDLPFDGLEALTPEPQGDVTIEEIHEAMGGKILLDGIPAVLFLPEFPMEALQRCVEELAERFAPELVLGISDEIPIGAPPESIERVKWIRGWCRTQA
jgi:hypothetical protein